MKRFVSFLIILSLFILPTFAVKTTVLCCDDVTVKQGEIFTVPLSLTNNNGIVALRIKIKYPHNVMELTDISSGELTQEGLFNTTVTDYYSVKGEFDVVWSTTENVVDDGTVVMLTFKVYDLAENGRYKIDLAYDKEDTFNENLEDVFLDCSPVLVTVNDGTAIFDEIVTGDSTEEKTTQENALNTESIVETTISKTENKTDDTGSTDPTIENSVSDDYFISSVESIIGSLNEPDIDNITDTSTQQNVLDFVNNRLDAFGENIPHIENFEELKDAFSEAKENEAVKDIVESTDSDVILSVFEEIKTQYGVEKLEDVPETNKQEVINKFTNTLSENSSDITSFNKLKEEEKIPVLEEIIEKVQEQEENAITITDNTSALTNNQLSSGIVIAIIGVMALIAISISVILTKRKRGEKS